MTASTRQRSEHFHSRDTFYQTQKTTRATTTFFAAATRPEVHHRTLSITTTIFNMSPLSLAMMHLVVLTLVVSAAAFEFLPDNAAVSYHPKAFTPAESVAIIKLMKQLPVEFDDRVDKSVKRTNYFDKGGAVTSKDSKYRWIFEKILPLYAPPPSQQYNDECDGSSDLEDFVSRIDFILLHEFDGGGFFDWHVDVKPGDNTGRTHNINVMLTERSQYAGGVLTVGLDDIPAQQGDCYSYPASFPHKVADITNGRRHTFIIAMKDLPEGEQSSTAKLDQVRQDYWETAERNHQQLCASNPSESKLHLLYGEFLTALGRPDEEVDAKYADMYASTKEAEEYAINFQNQGEMLEKDGRIEESKGYLNMANMIRSRILKIEHTSTQRRAHHEDTTLAFVHL
mmetsp:Transcript_30430/g.45946  ORF Transcript_30430/g.45946 Transcript_30430/m.45946 type:complete len:397 (+) Transcript_30430:2194-3384(+)